MTLTQAQRDFLLSNPDIRAQYESLKAHASETQASPETYLQVCWNCQGNPGGTSSHKRVTYPRDMTDYRKHLKSKLDRLNGRWLLTADILGLIGLSGEQMNVKWLLAVLERDYGGVVEKRVRKEDRRIEWTLKL